MIKLKFGATIPTTQYGNIMPEIELEGEDLAMLTERGEAYIQDLWTKYGERPLTNNKTNGLGIVYTTFTGEEVVYDDHAHAYFDTRGNRLESGSSFADKHSQKFDKAVMLPKTAKAWGVEERDLEDLWNLNTTVSTSYGTAIHNALEAYHRFVHLGEKVKDHKDLEHNYALPKNEHIRQIVSSFADQFGTDAEVEVLVSDVKNGRAGRIDRLQILDKDAKVCRIGDFKTNNELDQKKIDKYQLQLSFYAHILMSHGWKVEGLDLYHYSDHWEHIDIPIVNIDNLK